MCAFECMSERVFIRARVCVSICMPGCLSVCVRARLPQVIVFNNSGAVDLLSTESSRGNFIKMTSRDLCNFSHTAPCKQQLLGSRPCVMLYAAKPPPPPRRTHTPHHHHQQGASATRIRTRKNSHSVTTKQRLPINNYGTVQNLPRPSRRPRGVVHEHDTRRERARERGGGG